MYKNQKFHIYFNEWMHVYKLGAVSDVTYAKYVITQKQIQRLAPDLTLNNLNRLRYQELLNKYAESHEKQTTLDFHHQLKAALTDAVDEGLIRCDPSHRVVIKGTTQRKHKSKFLSQTELRELLNQLDLSQGRLMDHLILLIAKTGLRFAEALGLTKEDIDFQKQLLKIDKTWNYKTNEGGFAPTKNESSKRKIQIDWQTCMYLRDLVVDLKNDDLVFIRGKRLHNATLNDYLERLCNQASIPVISMHGLRHTHASMLLYAGVSVASVARRLGHSSITTTQRTYLHIIKELENQDNDRIMQFLGAF